MRLHPVQPVKQLCHRVGIGRMGGGKACPVDAIVDTFIDIRIDCIDIGAQIRRAIIITVACQIIEGTVEHADDLGRFV
jgi:hypothetical protein